MKVTGYLVSIFAGCYLGSVSSVYACDKAQMIDYDYQIKAPLGNSYSTFGRLWLLDNTQSCFAALQFGACLSIKPLGNIAELTIKVNKDAGTFTSYSQKIKYNSSEVIKFEAIAMDVYLKVYVSNTIADLKMSGKPCDSAFPNLPRAVTRQEIDIMFLG